LHGSRVLSAVVLAGLAAVGVGGDRVLTTKDILALPAPPADARIQYGPESLQFGDLRVPRGEGPHPVAIVIHGGCWLSEFNLDHIAPLCAALGDAGVATWSLEYRRIGDPGGGWPVTLQDVARGADSLRTLAELRRLDLGRVVVVGHSAGGQLALWLAGRRRMPRDSVLWTSDPLRLRGVVALAAVTDLQTGADCQVCDDAIDQLLERGSPHWADRVRVASPIELLPLGVPQRLIWGKHDSIVPLSLAHSYAAAARSSGDDVRLDVLERCGHFELIVPASAAWPTVRTAVLELTGLSGALL
jgi:acetyl esterase/lipase